MIVALVREHAETLRPPRTLWVPFPLGRPFGVPNNPAFQTKVLKAALDLFEVPEGPVLADFPEEAPEEVADEAMESWVCPVSFPKPPVPEDRTGLREAVLAEIGQLQPWYEVGRDRRGRTAVGLSGLAMNDAARFLDGWLAGETRESPIKTVGSADALRLSAEDLKAFYMEAATARPGVVGQKELSDWLWQETSLAEMLQSLRKTLLQEEDPELFDVGEFMLVPETYHA
ncbi:MAG: hypothetical protein AAF563_05065 [Pseudomonadota bacterium]